MAKERNAPRISVNKLGEYLTATARRRRTILVDQKIPPTFKVATYTEALKAMCNYLVSPEREERLAK